ncbi:MAG: O-antigen ligase family protein [candidate division Zixibacteria bacterium]|nr:O-antigen ligase family protein [candidate division Zixibacteria bacterium]
MKVEENTNLGLSPEMHRSTPLIKGRHIYLLLVIGVSVVAATALLVAPDKYQLPLILAIPAMVIGIYILKNPYFGIYLFFLYDTLRPYDFIYALQPLQLAIIIEGLTFLSWIIYLLRNKNKLNWHVFNWPFLGFLGLIGLSVFTAENNRLAYDIFIIMTVSFVMFIVATNTVDSTKRLEKLIWLFLMIHLYFAIRGIYNYYFGEPLPDGQRTSGIVGSSFLSDENDFALVINVLIPMTFFMFIALKKKFLKIFTGGLLVVYVFAIISSFSRGGWVGFMAVITYCILNSKKKLVSFTVVLMLGLVLISVAPSEYWQEIETISDTSESTADARIRYWKAALLMFSDYPILGVGAGNGGIWLPDYISGTANPGTEWGRAFHGTIPQILAELGTLGFICYVLMAYYAVKGLLKIRKRRATGKNNISRSVIANGLLGGIIAYFVTATFISTVYYPQLWMLYTLAIILIHIDRAESENVLEVPIEPEPKKIS